MHVLVLAVPVAAVLLVAVAVAVAPMLCGVAFPRELTTPRYLPSQHASIYSVRVLLTSSACFLI